MKQFLHRSKFLDDTLFQDNYFIFFQRGRTHTREILDHKKLKRKRSSNESRRALKRDWKGEAVRKLDKISGYPRSNKHHVRLRV